jgi:hypothetical protein
MNKPKTGRRKQYTMRLNVAAKLIAAYVKLSKDEKEIAEDFLALQIYGEGGMYPYRPFPELPWKLEVPSATDECPPLGWEKPWSDWAQVIRGSLLIGSERREAVKEMLGALIRQKDRRRRLTDQNLHEAAKTTLGWTRWDAKRLKWLWRTLGVTSLFEHNAWIEKSVAELWAKRRVRGKRKGARSSRPSTRRVKPGRNRRSG